MRGVGCLDRWCEEGRVGEGGGGRRGGSMHVPGDATRGMAGEAMGVRPGDATIVTLGDDTGLAPAANSHRVAK